jgi:hypothetical protein
MYWLPAVFLILEIIYFISIPELMKVAAMNKFKDRYKGKTTFSEEELKSLPNSNTVVVVFAFVFLVYITTTMIYYIVGLFHQYWTISLIMIAVSLISTSINKIFPNIIASDDEFDCFIDIDKIENLQIKRKLKLNALEGRTKSARTRILLYSYFRSIFRFVGPLLIILQHYHYGE